MDSKLTSDTTDTVPVTVGIPLHYAEIWYRRVINSLLSQAVKPAETIIVDDGTTDRLEEKIAELQEQIKLPNLKVLKVPRDFDISEKYNLIIEHASQRWLQIIDQDDFVLPNFFSNLREYLDYPVGAIATSVSSNMGAMDFLGRLVRIFIKDGVRVSRHIPILGTLTTRSAIIYATNICQVVKFPFPTSNGTDVIHLHELRSRSTLIFVPSAITHYEIHEKSFSKGKSRSVHPKSFLYFIDSCFRHAISKVLR